MASTTLRDNRKRIYNVESENSTCVVYVQWMQARNLRGFLWMYWNIWRIFRVMWRSDGMLDMHIGMSHPLKFVMFSYWRDNEALYKAYKDALHIMMMKYVFEHPDDFILGNETYAAPISTRYMNGRRGFAVAEPTEAINLEEFEKHHHNHKDYLEFYEKHS